MIRLDTKELTKFAATLRKTAPALSKEFGTALRAGGELVAQDARQRASFSRRIPGSIKVSRRAASVRITAGGPSAPDAAPFENKGKEGTFRHPVFGNYDVWVNQQAHPFLRPAGEANQEEVAAVFMRAVTDAFRKAGF